MCIKHLWRINLQRICPGLLQQTARRSLNKPGPCQQQDRAEPKLSQVQHLSIPLQMAASSTKTGQIKLPSGFSAPHRGRWPTSSSPQRRHSPCASPKFQRGEGCPSRSLDARSQVDLAKLDWQPASQRSLKYFAWPWVQIPAVTFVRGGV